MASPSGAMTVMAPPSGAGLARGTSHDSIVVIVAEDDQPLMLRSRGNEQANCACRSVLPGLSQALLDLAGPLEATFVHRDPAKQVPHQLLFLEPVGERPGRVQKLEFDDGADRDDTRGDGIGPAVSDVGVKNSE